MPHLPLKKNMQTDIADSSSVQSITNVVTKDYATDICERYSQSCLLSQGDNLRKHTLNKVIEC